MGRYEGKPLLRVLECYVLDAIGALQSDHRATMVKMEPKLARIYKTKGDWQTIIANVMGLPETVPKQIRQFWGQYQQHAKQQGLEADANQFAMSFVDQNLT